MGVGLWLAVAQAAEPTPSPTAIGATRDQLLVRYGEPRSQIVQGNRVIMFYPRERIVLVNEVVVEVEQLSPEPVRRPPAEPVTPAAPRGEAPAAKDAPSAPGVGTGAFTETAPPNAPASGTPAPATPPPPEPKVEIKLVRPPGSRPLPTADTTPPASSTTATTAPSERKESVPAVTDPAAEARAAKEAKRAQELAAAAEAKKAKELAAAKEAAEKKAKLEQARRRLDEVNLEDPVGGFFSGRTLLLLAAVLVAAIGYWIWRRKQKQLELAATSVGNTPVSPAAPAAAAKPSPAAAVKPAAGVTFTDQTLASLDAKRFEELVAEYYSKTGVVAVRASSSTPSPVHIRISWKGEPRPFACVQCLPNPSGPIEPKTLQEFVTALAAEDIRRGYVVTSGLFSAAAKSFAEQKQLTLMPGDMLLEKLNALPVSARAEIMRSVGLVA